MTDYERALIHAALTAHALHDRVFVSGCVICRYEQLTGQLVTVEPQ